MSFISIRLSTVKPGLIVPFDVYLKVADNYVHYLHKDDDFDQARLDALRMRGVKKFHINEEDELNYQAFLDQLLINVHLASDEVKTSIALDVTENSTQEMIKNPSTEKSYNMVRSSSEIVQKVLADNDVIDLIMAHEEKISGQGFPNKRTKLTTAQEVLSLCAFYDREVTCLGKDHKIVSNNLMIDQVGNYNLELLKQFKSFLKSYL
jgi:hypothetical protein